MVPRGDDQPIPGGVDRHRPSGTRGLGAGREHTAEDGAAGTDRADGRRRRLERPHRGRARCLRGHRSQVAGPVLSPGNRGTHRRTAYGTPTEILSVAGRRGQGMGMSASYRARAAPVAVERPGVGPAVGDRRHQRLRHDGPPLAFAGRPQTLAVPIVDLHPGPAIRDEGGRRPRPLCPQVQRSRVGGGRVRHLRG